MRAVALELVLRPLFFALGIRQLHSSCPVTLRRAPHTAALHEAVRTYMQGTSITLVQPSLGHSHLTGPASPSAAFGRSSSSAMSSAYSESLDSCDGRAPGKSAFSSAAKHVDRRGAGTRQQGRRI